MASGKKTTHLGYSTASRWLHWATALVVLATVAAGVVMTGQDLPRPLQNALFIFHKNIGVVILLLVILRLVVRSFSTVSPLPATIPLWQKRAAAASHAALYALLIIMAVSGYVRVRAGGFPIEALDAIGVPPLVPRSDTVADTAKAIHSNARFALVALIALHVGAALQHGLVKRDGVFSRIWPLNAPR